MGRVLNNATIVLGLFFFWLLATQAVIYCQVGNCIRLPGRMEGAKLKPIIGETQSEAQHSQDT